MKMSGLSWWRGRLSAQSFIIALVVSTSAALHAQVPQLINYQGRVVVGTTNFNGSGGFKFALVNAAGTTTYWSNNNSSVNGSEPTAAVSLTVSNGLYSVLLGDTAIANMTSAIPATVFNNSDVRLRVWFNDGTHASQLLSPDQRVAAVGYAVIASNVVDGAITSAKIAAGAVGSSQLASGLTLAGTTSGTFSGPLTGNATSATNATNATTATNATQLGGVVAANYVQTNDARLTDARAPTAGSGNYIQNTSSAQTANFNISGSGSAGGTLSGNVVNTATQYNIGSSRVLSNAGTNNLFAGISAGSSNTGLNNSFFGQGAGFPNTTGDSNSFFGSFAGLSNMTGSLNSFFGDRAGRNNTGGSNSFFGTTAGFSNTTGSSNTMIGTGADVSSGNLTNATAIGAGAVVSTSNSIALGRSDGSDTVQIPGALNVVGILGANNIGANTIGANIVNVTTQYNIGGNRVLSVAGTNNTLAGVFAGSSNTGTENSFFGRGAGFANTTGFSNSFFGWSAGTTNTMGKNNAFFGGEAGANSTSDSNSFFGSQAGFATNFGNNNVFFGSQAGSLNTTGSNNTIIGSSANVGSNNLTNATAIGYNAVVSSSDSLILGNGANVGIGTSVPTAKLVVASAFINSGENTATFKALSLGPNQSHIHYGTNGDWFIRSANVAGKVILQDTGGNVGIATLSPDATLTVNGTADKPGGGSWDTFSDERLKNIRGRFTPGLKAVMQLQPLRYEYKPDNALGINSEGEHIGFGAQEVQKIIPEAVTKNDQDYLLINNDPIMWTMLNAIKEQQAQIEQQQAQIEQQQKQIDALKAANLNRPKGRVR